MLLNATLEFLEITNLQFCDFRVQPKQWRTVRMILEFIQTFLFKQYFLVYFYCSSAWNNEIFNKFEWQLVL